MAYALFSASRLNPLGGRQQLDQAGQEIEVQSPACLRYRYSIYLDEQVCRSFLRNECKALMPDSLFGITSGRSEAIEAWCGD